MASNLRVTNNTPNVYLNGIDDQSVLPLVAEPEVSPIHLPLMYLQTAWGDTEDVTMVMPGTDLERMCGAETIDPRGPFYNHATALALCILEQGNAIMVKRVTRGTPGATETDPFTNMPAKAKLTLVLDFNSAVGTINKYARDINGNVIFDENNNLTYVSPAEAISGGIKVTTKWMEINFTDSTDTATYKSPAAMSTGWAGTSGHWIYPILSVEAPFVGSLGNRTGIRLWAATPGTLLEADQEIVNDQQALLFNAQLVNKVPNTTPTITSTLIGEMVVDFMLKPNAFNFKYDTDLTPQDLVTKFTDDGVELMTSPTYGPLGKVTVHQSSLEAALAVLKVAEDLNRLDENGDSIPTPIWMLNFLSGIDAEGKHHYGFQISTASDSDKITESFTAYLTGGADGDLSNETFDLEVASEVIYNYQNPKYPLQDSARFPFSAIYDSGFGTNTKKALMRWMDYRKNVHVAIGTHIVGEPQLTIEQEIDAGINLRNTALMYAESPLWGTPACRMVLMMQSGLLVNNRMHDPVSTVFDLAIKRAMYMGAGDGAMKASLGYDNAPANQVTFMKKLTNTSLLEMAKKQAWGAGLNGARCFDRHKFFFPALQTIYSIQNSVLTSEMIMQICCDVEKQSEIVWRLLSGNTTYTEAQFIKASNELLLELVANKYDNRVIIIPNTYFTAADMARGYSWVLDVTVYGNVAKTVSQVNVITKRTSMLGQ